MYEMRLETEFSFKYHDDINENTIKLICIRNYTEMSSLVDLILFHLFLHYDIPISDCKKQLIQISFVEPKWAPKQ